MANEIETGYYGGQKVTVLSRYKVDGGIAIRVRRHPDATDWPWTVDDFTTADENIKPTPAQMDVEIEPDVADDWVAIGWVDVGEATKEDIEKYPTAID